MTNPSSAQPDAHPNPSTLGSSQGESAGGSRTAANVFIACFLALQVAVPLTYYLGDHGYDERFSWRMFSTLRLQECESSVLERRAGDTQDQPVAIGRDVQVAWVNLMERDRKAVVAKYLARRCEAGASEVSYVRSCEGTQGERLAETRRVMDCASGTLREATAPKQPTASKEPSR